MPIGTYQFETPPGHEFLSDAVNRDAYEFLSSGQYPYYLEAIEKAVGQGATAEEVRLFIGKLVGPDRQALALRCGQAAAYIRKTFLEREPTFKMMEREK